MLAACLLSFVVGFLSLSQEILWVRLFGFVNQSQPQAFAFVLVTYLIGIALGAMIGNGICRHFRSLWVISGCVLLTASIFDVLGPWGYACLSQGSWQLIGGGIIITMTALLKSIIFPIAHHIGTPASETRVGHAISRVYVSNIIGATLGPIITGLLALNLFTTQQCFILCAGGTFLISLFCLTNYLRIVLQIPAFSLGVALIALMFNYHPSWLIQKTATPISRILQVVENQHGIITVYQGKEGGDYVFGGNVYDGRTNLDPIINSNGINRLIVLAALQDKPKRVLMIGLSIGTWLKVVTSFPGIQKIDVVEINPGYLKAMAQYPRQLSALKDPRVHLFIDDGRRFLRTHPDEKYDLIVMNTTYYWRAYSSNLLSQEFLTMLKQHMTPHAVLEFNTTYSLDALKTASTVFPHTYLYMNFAIASNDNWRLKLREPASAAKLAALKLDNKPLFPAGSKKIIREFLQVSVSSYDELMALAYPLLSKFNFLPEVITDNNLVTEYKHGARLGQQHS